MTARPLRNSYCAVGRPLSVRAASVFAWHGRSLHGPDRSAAATWRFVAEMHDFYCELLSAWAHTDVDALRFMDDLGSQRSLLISPATWRDIFKPMYRDYAQIAHAAGKKLFMHSDGHILAIYPDLVEIGIDAVNSQIFCMGVDQLAQFAGH